MQERISAYVAMLEGRNIKNISNYETPARECATYFDERGIDAPTAEDWKDFAEYFSKKFEAEKGKKPSKDTLQTNYISRGKKFYRWCNGQQEAQHTAPLFAEDKTEAITPPAPEEDTPRPTESPAEEAANNPESEEAEKHSGEIAEDTAPQSKTEQGKSPRVNFLVDESLHSALMSLAYLKGKTLTAILTEALKKYIEGYKEEIATLEETRRKLRSK